MKKSLLVVAALCGLSTVAQATELFVNISSDETMAQGAGLVLIAFGVVFCGVSAHGVIDCCWILIPYIS